VTFRRRPKIVFVTTLIAATITALLVAATPAGAHLESSAAQRQGQPVIIGTPHWPAPPADQVLALVKKAGLKAEPAELLRYHVHSHLDIFIDGNFQIIPGGIGIVITDPAVHSGLILGQPAYGSIDPPCKHACISPLHTHDVTGILHTESATRKNNTLAQFFTEWNVRLDANCVGEFCTPQTKIAVYVNGKRKPLASASKITLSDRKEIAIVIGQRPKRIPSKVPF